MIDREYEYRLKAGRVEVRALLFGTGGLFCAYMAMTNDRGLELFCIPLDMHKATVAYWVFAVLAGAFAVFDGVSAARRGPLRQRIAFTGDGLLVPESDWTEAEMLIPYASICKITPFDEPECVVIIDYGAGEFTLKLSMLRDERIFAEILQTLVRRVQEAHEKGSSKPPGFAGPNLE